MPSDVKWKKREKRNDKEDHEKASIRTGFFLFYFWENETFCEEKIQVNFLLEAAVRRCTSK